MQTLAATAAIAAACLIGLASPTIRFVFGERWLPATTAVQFCLAGSLPTAILAVLASDANARLMRHASMASAICGGLATLAVLWPLAAFGGVGGAAAAAYCVGPIVATAVFVWRIPAPISGAVARSLRLFVPLLAISLLLGHVAQTPVKFAGACLAMGAAAVVAAYLAEAPLVRRLLRVVRPRADLPVVDLVSGSPVAP